MTEEAKVEVVDNDEEKDVEAIFDKILQEFGCESWDDCAGKKIDIVDKAINEYGLSIEEVAEHLNVEPRFIKIWLKRKNLSSSSSESSTQKTPAKKSKKSSMNLQTYDGNLEMEYDHQPFETDIGIAIEHPYSEYIPSTIRIHGREYTPDELVEEFGTSGLQLLKIQAFIRVLRYGPAFRQPPKKFIQAIANQLLMYPALVDNPQALWSLMAMYNIEKQLASLAFTVLSYLDQTYRDLAKRVDSVATPVVSWSAVERNDSITFIPNQSMTPTPSPFPNNGNNPAQSPFPVNQFMNPYQPQPVGQTPYPAFGNPINPPPYPVVPPYSPPPVPDSTKEELRKKDEEIEELKSMIQALLEEKRQKEEEEKERKRLEMIREIIDSKISSISSRLSTLEMKLTSPASDEDEEKKYLREMIQSLKDELKDLKNEMTKKEIESLKSMIETLERRLEEKSRSPFPADMNQYMVDFMIKKLETEADLIKVQEQTKAIESALDKLKETFTSAANTFGRAIGRQLVFKPTREPDANWGETICPWCGRKVFYPLDAENPACPFCFGSLKQVKKMTPEEWKHIKDSSKQSKKKTKPEKKKKEEQKSEEKAEEPLDETVE